MTTFQLVNDGKDLHHITIVRIDSGKTLADLKHELAMPAAPPSWVSLMGGPNAVGPAQESNATLDLTPGSYAMVCFVDQPGGVPHFAKGMIRPFTVIAGPAGATAAAPTADATIQLSDYAFDVSKPLTAGKHTIEMGFERPWWLLASWLLWPGITLGAWFVTRRLERRRAAAGGPELAPARVVE